MADKMADDAGKLPAAGATVRLGLIVAVMAVLVDQVHKLWSIYGLGIGPHDRYALTPFFDVIYVLNRGISYGLFQMNSLRGQLFLAGFALVVAVVLVVWLVRGRHSRFVGTAIGLVIGGAVGNAIDRVHLGGVADFFSLHAFGYSWYIFNIADVAIVAGIIGLLYDSLILSRNGAAKRT